MTDQKAWTPDQPLRADATDEQIAARAWNRIGVSGTQAAAAVLVINEIRAATATGIDAGFLDGLGVRHSIVTEKASTSRELGEVVRRMILAEAAALPVPPAGTRGAVECPFCGNTQVAMHPNDLAASGRQMGRPGIDVFYAHCDGCGAEGPQADNEPDAIAAWNRRAALPVSPAGTREAVAALSPAESLDDYVAHHWTCPSTHDTGRDCDCAYPRIIAALTTRGPNDD